MKITINTSMQASFGVEIFDGRANHCSCVLDFVKGEDH